MLSSPQPKIVSRDYKYPLFARYVCNSAPLPLLPPCFALVVSHCTGGLACPRKAEKETTMEKNEVHGATSQAQEHIEMKRNVVYGVTTKPSDQVYENPLAS